MFSTGVIPTISSVIRKLTTPAENVLIMTPVYNIFYNCILNNGRNVLESELIYEDGKYHIDWVDLERKIKKPQTSMMLFCNPHNPAGNIWDRDTIARIGELCEKYHVVVISDEIHCDIADPGFEYVPFASVSEKCAMNSITCISPTKAFNIAGLQTSAVVVPDGNLRHKVWRGLNTDEVAEPNSFAIAASIAAYNEGEEWLDELRGYIADNKLLVRAFIEENLPELKIVDSHATYLMWIDCSAITGDTKNFCRKLRKDTGLFITNGGQYGDCGKKFVRVNVACPRSMVADGLGRLKTGVKIWMK